MNQKPFNLILLGDPAAGKATQAARIAKRYRMIDLDMGRELRKPAVRRRFDYERLTARGKLTPTAVVRDILRENIAHAPAGRGILFDGTPKMIGEARLVFRLLREAGRSDPLVIYLQVPVAETMRRMTKRGRKDDTREAFLNRVAYYRNEVARTVAFFKTVYRFKKISGLGTPDDVAARIEKEKERFLKMQNENPKPKTFLFLSK
jgi:adenylate kinase